MEQPDRQSVITTKHPERPFVHTTIHPSWRVAATNGHVGAGTSQVGGHLVALVAASPTALWLVFGLAVLLIGVVFVPAAWSAEDDRRRDAIEVITLIARVLRPAAIPDKPERRHRPVHRCRRPRLGPEERRRSLSTRPPKRRRRQRRPGKRNTRRLQIWLR